MKTWIAVICIVVGSALLLWPKLKPAAAGPEDGVPGGSQKVAPVQSKDIQFSITVAGTIGPKEEVSVRPEVNGRIAELPVDVGDMVRKGELLFALDDKDLQIEISSRQTEIKAAELQLEKARRDYEREQELYEANLVAREVFEDAKTQYELAQNSIERANRNLDLAKDRLSKTRIMAPFDCTVLTRSVTGVGQAVSGSGGYNSGTEVMTIANLKEMIINAHVNQVDVTRMRVGQEVKVQVEAVSGLEVKGVVERVAPQATVKNNIKGFGVRVVINKTDPRIQPGMTANIVIPVDSAEKVTSVPLAAVFTEFSERSGRTERYVYRQKGQQFERTPVKVGVSDYFYAEIVDGLAEGDLVAIEMPSQEQIIDGQTVDQKAPAGGVGSKQRGT